jgi:HSP20 family protein
MPHRNRPPSGKAVHIQRFSSGKLRSRGLATFKGGCKIFRSNRGRLGCPIADRAVPETLTTQTQIPTSSAAKTTSLYGGVVMVMGYADPFETLFAFQRALENRLASDWLGTTTASMGTYPPVNVFQQDDDLVAIVELPGVNKDDLNIQAKGNTIRIAGSKAIDYPENVSLHRRERLSGVFDRTLVVPMQVDPDSIKAEYNDGLLALFIPRAEQDKPKSIQIS